MTRHHPSCPCRQGASASECIGCGRRFTPEELEHMATVLGEQFPDLAVTVSQDAEGVLHIDALPRHD